MKNLLFIPILFLSTTAFAFGVDVYTTDKTEQSLTDAAKSYGWIESSGVAPDEFLESAIIDDLKFSAVNYRLREDMRSLEMVNRQSLETSVVIENWDETKE